MTSSIELPIRPFLDLSLDHLSPATRTWLGDCDGIVAAKTTYGWWVYAPESPGSQLPEADWPQELLAIVQLARANGCTYVMFDVDGPCVDQLPTFARHDLETFGPDNPLRGSMIDGHTSEDVNRVFAVFSQACDLTLVCVWEYVDGYGTGGHSQFYVQGRDGLHELAGGVWGWLTADPDDPDAPKDLGEPASWVGPLSNEVTLSGCEWSDGFHNLAIRDRHRSDDN